MKNYLNKISRKMKLGISIDRLSEDLENAYKKSRSEKSNMTCNRPENISLHGNVGCIPITLIMHTVFATFIVKKKALLLVWEDLDKAVNKRSEEKQ
ncbi:hypothetical protein KSF78_0007754 [Schistosoma japonicum]|nr:hypothetical protein KSF78_0007754 [Schistosoma japonicum]